LDDDDRWQADLDGEMCVPHADATLAENVTTIWTSGLRISEDHYRWLVAMKDYCRMNDPAHPCLHPRVPIDHRILAPLIPRSVFHG
jgi:hypothetical protein